MITDAGVVLIDAGGSWKGAQEIDAAIDTFTDKPVRIVINTGGQDHRWLGNGYWKTQGARLVASQSAVTDQKERASMQLSVLTNLLGEALRGTEPVYADETFVNETEISFGGVVFQLEHPGQAHTPGDSFVFLPAAGVLFSGDIIYTERMLAVIPQSNTKSWIAALDAIDTHNPEHVVPGHGAPTTLDRAWKDTYGYLVNLREKIGTHIEAGGDMIDSVHVDQSAFAYLEQFEALAGRNAQQVFSEMEWE